MGLNLWLRLPRPQRLLFFFSLSTANIFLLYIFIINKAASLYGLLSPLTGAPMSLLQGSMYVYSVALFALVLFYLAPRITFSSTSLAPDPFRTLIWAYLYSIDSVVNAVYTAAFAFLWFVHVAEEEASKEDGSSEGTRSGSDLPLDFGKALFQNGSIVSLVLIVLLWVLRFYSVFIVLSYARLVIGHHIAINSSPMAFDGPNYPATADSVELAEDPFRIGTEAGEGWKGRLGRVLINFGRTYWLSKDASVPSDLESGPGSAWLNSWARKFGSSSEGSNLVPLKALEERERRRRSGTGPPVPTGLGRLAVDTQQRSKSIEIQ